MYKNRRHASAKAVCAPVSTLPFTDAQDHDLTLEMCGACKRTLAGPFASLTGLRWGNNYCSGV